MNRFLIDFVWFFSATIFFLSYKCQLRADEDAILFRGKCVQCHALPDAESLNAKQWKAVLNTMQKRMREAGKAQLTQAELHNIYCYLTKNEEAACKGVSSPP